MKRIAVIGAGVIGLSWAELFAGKGWDVAVYDVAPDAIPAGRGFEITGSIADAVRGASFVQENGPERLDVKRELLAEIAAAAGNDTVIASSTSSLLPSLLSEGNPRARQIVVGHPYNPPSIMPLVEVVPGPQTDPAIVDRAVAVYRSIGKLPVALQKEIPGFVGNRVQKAVLDEAMWLVQQGIIDPAGFDAIVRHSLGLRWASTGVFEASHLGGGQAGIRHLLEHVGVAMDAITLQAPSRDAEQSEKIAYAVESAYGAADSYETRAQRRDRITAAVAGTVAREHTHPVLYALSVVQGGVHRIDPATGAVDNLVTGLIEFPDGIVVDQDGDRVVFTLMGTPDRIPEPGNEPPFTAKNGSVRAVGIGGGEVTTLVEKGAFTTGKQITRDETSGRLYWTDREGHGVYRSEADGSGLIPLVLTSGTAATPAEEECVGIAVDALRGHLYWTQKGPSDAGKGKIFRAGLELPAGQTAAQRDDIELLWNELPEPIDLELDLSHDVI